MILDTATTCTWQLKFLVENVSWYKLAQIIKTKAAEKKVI